MLKRREIFIICIIVTLAIVSRLILLDLRPLHHDEGVNYFFANGILETGKFVYDPLNYHGPSYFFMLFLSFLFFGISEFSLRFPTALFGVLTAAILLFYYPSRHRNYVATLFIIASPSLMYYSRYSIHESLFVLSGLVAVLSLTKILESQKLDSLPVFALALAFLFTTKETAVIMVAILGVLCCVHHQRVREIQWKAREHHNALLFSLLLVTAVYILFFTSFFQNLPGLKDSFQGYMPWTKRGFNEIGHMKPFTYYFSLLRIYEFPLLILALLGIGYAFRHRKDLLAVNVALWCTLIFLIYSTIGYKTPWLIVNMSLPLAILASFGVQTLNNRKLKILVVLLTLSFLFSVSIHVNFMRPWQPDNRYAYVHTDSNILNLIGEINSHYQEGEKILMVSDAYWPLPFYLHGKNVEYLEQEKEIIYANHPSYRFFIIKEGIFLNSKLPPTHSLLGKFTLREGERLYLIEQKN